MYVWQRKLEKLFRSFLNLFCKDDFEVFDNLSVENQTEYPLPKEITGIPLVMIDQKPVNFEIVLRLKHPPRLNTKIQVIALRDHLDK